MNLTALRTLSSSSLRSLNTTGFIADKTIRWIASPTSQLLLFTGTLAIVALAQNYLLNKSNNYKNAEKLTQLSIRTVALMATASGLVALSPYVGLTHVTVQLAIKLGMIATIVQGILLFANDHQKKEENEPLLNKGREYQIKLEAFEEKYLANRARRKQQNVDKLIDDWLQRVKVKVEKRRVALEEARKQREIEIATEKHKKDIEAFTNKVAVARTLRTQKNADQLIHQWFERTRTRLEKQRILAKEEAAKKHQEKIEAFQNKILAKKAERECQTQQKANKLIDNWFQKTQGKLKEQRLAAEELKKQQEAEEAAKKLQEQIEAFQAKQLAKREIQSQQKANQLMLNWVQKAKANLNAKRLDAIKKLEEPIIASSIQEELDEKPARRSVCNLLEEKAKSLFEHMIWNRLAVRFMRKSRSK